MDLTDILAIDWNQMLDGVPSLGQLRDEEPERFDEIIAKETERMRQMEYEFSELPLLSFLHKINTDGRMREMHQTYLTLACLGVSGMEWMARYWYSRNLMIFKNILDTERRARGTDCCHIRIGTCVLAPATSDG